MDPVLSYLMDFDCSVEDAISHASSTCNLYMLQQIFLQYHINYCDDHELINKILNIARTNGHLEIVEFLLSVITQQKTIKQF